MNADTLAKNYPTLTPEERFCLILKASGRGDDAERDRLVKAGPRISFAIPEHAPYSLAFDELAMVTFMELVEDSAHYVELFDRYDDACDFDKKAEKADTETTETDPPHDEGAEDGDSEERPVWLRFLDLAYAAGYVLRTKAEAWKLFCERKTIPPFLLWEGFPGFDRLQRALSLAEKAAFNAEGFLRWVNTNRPPGEPECTEVAITVEKIATETERMFRQRVEWHGGS